MIQTGNLSRVVVVSLCKSDHFRGGGNISNPGSYAPPTITTARRSRTRYYRFATLDTYTTGPNQSGGSDVQNARNERS
jgi:hypothetical protein